MSFPVIVPSDGVKMQALTWRDALVKAGHEVELYSSWDSPVWQDFDVVQCFGYGGYMPELVSRIYKINPNIALSPIIDSTASTFMFKLASYWGSRRLRLSSEYFELRRVKDFIKLFLVRSEYEKNFMTKSYGIPEERIALVPLSYRLSPPARLPEKEPLCLHVSLLADERKNVRRLIEAAGKYDFKLVLAGKLRNDEERAKIEGYMAGAKNVSYAGFLSDEQLGDLYSRARVFALPSTYEGVGLVALDAAVFGCDIVITELGGPKEYYGDMAAVVDPYSVDEIGRAVKSFMDGRTFQPALREYVMDRFNTATAADMLTGYYNNMAGR
jgi:glycosyltransferase involved in cell wall biosynthesis